MKTVTRTSIVVVAALAWLAASPAWAAGPRTAPGYRSSRMAANPNAQSRVSSRTTAQAAPATAAPESVAAPAPDGQSFAGEGDPSMWEGAYDGGFYDDYGDGGCADGSCGIGTCGTCRRGLFYFSADYLLVRPRLSQGVAEVQQTQQVSVVGTQTSTNTIDNSVNYCFAYNSSFRVALGYRLLDCGGDIQFSYWRLTGSAQVGDGPASLSNNQLTIFGQLGNNPGTGDFFNANTSITANIYDLDFAKCLAFGGPQGDCDCSSARAGTCGSWPACASPTSTATTTTP